MRRALTAALLLLLIGSGLVILQLRPSSPRHPSTPLVPPGTQVAPFTVTLRSTVTTETGRIHEHSLETLAQRSDGTSVRAFHDGAGPVRQIRFGDGVVVELKDAIGGKSTIYRPIVNSWILDPSQDCATDVFGQPLAPSLVARAAVPLEEIAGYRAARITTGYTTRWFALDAGCALIRQSRTVPNGRVHLMDLVNLVPGEPDPALFAIPDFYDEGAPSQFMPPPPEPCNERCQQNHSNYRASLDKNYFEERVVESPTSRRTIQR